MDIQMMHSHLSAALARSRPALALLSILCVLVSACGHDQPESANEYLALINDPDNGLTSSHSDNGVQYTAKYLPTGYLMARDRWDDGIVRSDTATMRKRYDSCLYFLVTIETPAQLRTQPPVLGDSLMAVGKQLQELSLNHELATKFMAHYGGGRMDAIGAYAEGTGGLSGPQNVIVVFPRPDGTSAHETFEIVFDGQSIHAGSQLFQFRMEDIEHTSSI